MYGIDRAQIVAESLKHRSSANRDLRVSLVGAIEGEDDLSSLAFATARLFRKAKDDKGRLQLHSQSPADAFVV